MILAKDLKAGAYYKTKVNGLYAYVESVAAVGQMVEVVRWLEVWESC